MKPKLWALISIILILTLMPMWSIAQNLVNSKTTYSKEKPSGKFEIHQFVQGSKGTIDNMAYLLDTETGDVWIVEPIGRTKKKIKELK